MTYRYVGIIVGPSVYKGIKLGKTYYENLIFYEKIGKSLNIVPCYFQLKDINPGMQNIKAYLKQSDNSYKLTTIPKPQIIHNRIFTNNIEEKNKIKLLQNEGILIFNEDNRYTKLAIHKILIKNPDLLPFVPETVKASKGNLRYMMKKYNELIIKPNSSSLGVNILKLKRIKNENWELKYHNRNLLIKEHFSNKWPVMLEDALTAHQNIIQKRIELSLYKGSPFDLRVSVQKNGSGEWQVTGIVCKVAKKGKFITNVAQGGSCFPLEEILRELPHLDILQVYKDIELLSLSVAQQIEGEVSNIADLGLDIGITNEGVPMFIECNGRDLRVTFRKANLLKEWEATHSTPIKFANFLLEKFKHNFKQIDDGH
ncbi:hypothetical protein JOC75_001143 [Metabacillus crassostreae]|uniref:YheC/YheD family protein n=1 Tax=Metabacillus crassostreae TaxID=929098 RepID=UPI001958AD34|nr:hypothetical protein [Metabacillus crassostreae]